MFDHVQKCVKLFHQIMVLLGVDIPPLNGVILQCILMSKKKYDGYAGVFVYGEVLAAVHKRMDDIQNVLKSKVDQLRERMKMEEEAQRMTFFYEGQRLLKEEQEQRKAAGKEKVEEVWNTLTMAAAAASAAAAAGSAAANATANAVVAAAGEDTTAVQSMK